MFVGTLYTKMDCDLGDELNHDNIHQLSIGWTSQGRTQWGGGAAGVQCAAKRPKIEI
jgi:hypothetical protein